MKQLRDWLSSFTQFLLAVWSGGHKKRADDYKEKNTKLIEINKLKTDFVSLVSHELRTPLTAIKGSIGLILGGVTGEIPNEAQELLKISQKNTERLIRLISELLDVAKIEAGAMRLRLAKHSLTETIQHSVIALTPTARENGITIVLEIPEQSAMLVVDRDRIEQVIMNLLSNAIKFSDEGGKVVVRVQHQPNHVLISVQDEGCGIPEQFLSQIFEKFQQAENTSNKAKEGTGLGLTIAKALVDEHQGKIWAESKVGKGSLFSFSLPWNGKDFEQNPEGPSEEGSRDSEQNAA